MTPARFPEQNVVYAEHQKEYVPLPALRDPEGKVLTCWRLSWRERFKLLLTGRLWVLMLTFGGPPQPILPLADRPTIEPPAAGRPKGAK